MALVQAGGQPGQDQLQNAARIVDDRLARDDRVVERTLLEATLQGNASSEYILPPNPTWQPLVKVQTLQFPDAVLQDFDYGATKSAMGVFPDIERIWITLDNRLYLWDYQEGADFASFDELEQIILTVGLVKPKPGVFVADVHYLLVLATPLAVTLVGLSSRPSSTGQRSPEISLYMTNLSVATDGVAFSNVASHPPTGRIFLIGRPAHSTGAAPEAGGDLYELDYRSEEGWFRSKCRLTNLTRGAAGLGNLLPSWIGAAGGAGLEDLVVDASRNLLYVLTKSNSIRMYSLGPQGTAAPVESASVDHLVRDAQSMCPGAGHILEARTFQIVALSVIEKSEGGHVGLVATTRTGVRLYLSLGPRRSYGYSYSYAHPQGGSLWLCHVRLPPRPAQPAPPAPSTQGAFNAPAPAPSSAFGDVQEALYSSPSGVFIAASALPSSTDQIVLTTSTDVGRAALGVAMNQQPAISETAGALPVDGIVTGIAELGSSASGETELASQFGGPQRMWLVATNSGAVLLARQRPVDVLKALLDNSAGREQELMQFWDSYGRDQSCAMCAYVAAQEPRYPPGYTNGFGTVPGKEAAAQARRLFFEYSGRPEPMGQQFATTSSSLPAGDAKVLFSGRHEGIAICLARLLRPIWKSNVLKTDPKNPKVQASAVDEHVLGQVQSELGKLRTFVEDDASWATSAKATRPEQALEHTSLVGLRGLLVQAVEAIAFILVLADYKLNEIVSSSSPEVATTFKSMTYRDFLVTEKGAELARDLVRTLINHHIGRSMSVEAISETLQQKCGSFCSSDDVVLYKAIESLNKASETTHEQERWALVNEALRLFTKAAKHIKEDQMRNTCSTMLRLHFPDNAVHLALACASAWDPQELALAFWQDGLPQNDGRRAAFDTRQRCYDCVKNALTTVDSQLNDAVNGVGGLSKDEAENLRATAREAAFSSHDELLHFTLYDWLLEQHMTDRILELRTPFIESYLVQDSDSLEKPDLLWRFYVQTSRPFQASRTLAKMAESTEFDTPIARRCELLSAAAASAKSAPTVNGHEADLFSFITDVEEKLEVAKVQIDVEAAVRDLAPDEVPEARKQEVLHALRSRLLSITELYSEIAQPLGLYESTLRIFDVADHRDEALIRDTWNEIIDAAHKGRGGQVGGGAAVAGKATELARAFYPSAVVFDLSLVVDMLEAYALRYAANPAHWVPAALHAGGVPWQALWETLDELFVARLPPWVEGEPLVFLASELAFVVTTWTDEVAAYPPNPSSDLPVARLADALDQYVAFFVQAVDRARDEGEQQAAETLNRLRAAKKVLTTRY